MNESDDKDEVILRIKMENKRGKHYISLDRKDFTMYPNEKEVLLQEGLVAKVESCEESHDGVTVFNLYISDKMVEREKKKRTRDFIIPVIMLSIHYLAYLYLYVLEIQLN